MTSPCVLLVDDDPHILEGLKDILEDAHITVSTASSAAQALQMAGPVSPALAIIDFQLPDATGIELAARLRATYPPILLWLMTGMASLDVSPPAGLLDATLTKPVDPAELLQRLQRTLSSL